jgi:ribosome maturation factor RimP
LIFYPRKVIYRTTSLIGTGGPLQAAASGPAAFLFAGTAILKTKTPFEDKLLAIVEPVARDLGFEVVRIRVIGGARRKRLQVMAERGSSSPRPGTMSVEDCANLSRAVSAVLDVADPFAGEWDLEVSSPGIDRPLTELIHFDRWKGHEVKLELDRMVEGRKRFSGTIAGVDGENVLVDLRGEEATTALLPFAWIADAKLVLTDALIAESLKGRGGVAAKDGAPDLADEAFDDILDEGGDEDLDEDEDVSDTDEDRSDDDEEENNEEED